MPLSPWIRTEMSLAAMLRDRARIFSMPGSAVRIPRDGAGRAITDSTAFFRESKEKGFRR